MIKTVTQDQLIRFIYGETGTEESKEISATLRTDWELMEQYEMLLDTQRQLDSARVSPSQQVVDRIKRYSESTAPMEHHF